MEIITSDITVNCGSHNSIYNITEEIKNAIRESELQEGQACIFAIGSTSGISTLEFEPGLVKHDVDNMFKLFAPYNRPYEHNKTWGDDNGASHLRSFITGSSYNVPFKGGKLMLGTWQQVVLVNYDTRNRERKVVVQLIGK